MIRKKIACHLKKVVNYLKINRVSKKWKKKAKYK